MNPLVPPSTEEVISRAYEEDLGEAGDVTSTATIPYQHRSRARFVARAPGCLAGIPIVAMCMAHVDATIASTQIISDGHFVEANTTVLTAEGPTRSLLAAERVALNLLGQLSGVATSTRRFVNAVEGTDALITDTRKTTPGLRELEKYAVAAGGGVNHRMGLFDAVLIKDNHLVASASVVSAVAKARQVVGDSMVIEVEVDTLDQLREVLTTDADVVLLDNMTTGQLTEAVGLVNGRMRTEASGGVTLETIREIADTGVDTISVGWLTHSAPALDVAMDLETIHGTG